MEAKHYNCPMIVCLERGCNIMNVHCIYMSASAETVHVCTLVYGFVLCAGGSTDAAYPTLNTSD